MLLPPLTPERGRQIVAGFARGRVLIVGDAMLDAFIIGRVTRVSPEAPVPVVAFHREMYRVGGAANVAHNVAALSGQVVLSEHAASKHPAPGQTTLVAVIGTDDAAVSLRAGCREAGVTPAFIEDASRRTTRKVRIVTERNQQVARIDYEDDTEISGAIEARVVDAIRTYAAQADVIVISDYLKGTISAAVAQAAIAAGQQAGVPVLVDPKIPHLPYYAGATLVTPNHHEAEAATHARVRSDDDARLVARTFRDLARCSAVLMTRGDQGVWLLGGSVEGGSVEGSSIEDSSVEGSSVTDDSVGGSPNIGAEAEGRVEGIANSGTRDIEGSLPAAAREVADVTGAGDTVVAAMALALAAGATMAEAAWLANQAAGISVGKFGPATVSPAELLLAIGLEVGSR